MKLKVLTPTHIGDGGEIIPWEYVLNGSKVGIYPVEYLSQKLSENLSGQRLRNTLLELRNEVKRQGFGANLGSFLRNANLNIEPMYVLDCHAKLKDREYKPIKSFIKTSGKVYIPGSEVKGALRTAFVFGIIKKGLEKGDRKLFDKIRDIVREAVNKVREANRKKARKIWDRYFSEIETLVLRKGSPETDNAKYDLFKAVEVSDSEVKNPSECLFLDSIKVIGTRRPIYEVAEFLKPGIGFNMEIKINENTKKSLRRTMNNEYIDLLTMEFLKESAISFYRYILSIDERFFKSHSSEVETDPHIEAKEAINRGDFILRIGKHQGFLNLTLMSVILPDKNLYKDMYKLAVPNPRDEVNKTRKVTSGGYSIGWCRLEES